MRFELHGCSLALLLRKEKKEKEKGRKQARFSRRDNIQERKVNIFTGEIVVDFLLALNYRAAVEILHVTKVA